MSRGVDVGAIARRAGVGALALSHAQAAASFFQTYGEVIIARLRQFGLNEGNVDKVYGAIAQRIVLAFASGNIDPKEVSTGLAVRIAENAALNFQRFGQPFSEGEFLEASRDEMAAAFLKRYRNAMWYGMNMQGVPEGEREDLWQDISMAVLRRYRRKPYTNETLTLAVHIARQASIEHMRVKARRPVGDLPDVLVSNEEDVTDQLARMELHDRLHACIELLTPLQRRVIKGQLAGKTLIEMAKADRVGEEKVKGLAHRARVRLRQLLGNPLYR